MKNTVIFALIMMLFFMPVVLFTKLITYFEDCKKEWAIEKFEKDKKIEEMEKRIRLLEQDVYIINYGYEVEDVR